MVTFHSFARLAFFTTIFTLFYLAGAAPTSSHGPDALQRRTPPPLLLRYPAPNVPHTTLLPRGQYVLRNDSETGLQAIDPKTRIPIQQAPATDGAGKDYDAAALIWIGYSFIIGLPMMLAGLKLGRVATGVGAGVVTSLLAWSAIINSLSANPLSSLLIVLIVLGFFIVGLTLGCLRWGMHVGMVLLCISAGLSLGVRLAIIKEGLLIGSGSVLQKVKSSTVGNAAVVEVGGGYEGNWIIIGILGALFGGLVFWSKTRRPIIATSCASIGTFFTFLAIDLCANRQSGMSQGLRFLFDRNTAHVVDLLTTGYKPPISTYVLLAISFALTPACAYAQHRFFKGDFLPEMRGQYDPTMPQDVDGDTRSEVFPIANVHGGPNYMRRVSMYLFDLPPPTQQPAAAAPTAGAGRHQAPLLPGSQSTLSVNEQAEKRKSMVTFGVADPKEELQRREKMEEGAGVGKKLFGWMKR